MPSPDFSMIYRVQLFLLAASCVVVSAYSFCGSNLSLDATPQVDAPVNKTSTDSPALQPQPYTAPVKPLHGGVVGGVIPLPSASPAVGRLASAWTLDERLESRCNRPKAEERTRQAERARIEFNAEFVSRGLLPAGQSVGTTRRADVISGRFHPELFLPHELFQNVVRGAAFDAGYRRAFEARAQSAGLPPDFWSRLASLSTAFIGDLRAQRDRLSDKSAAGRALAMANWVALDRKTCHDRAIALRAARAAFGTALDHFMYEYVAPSLSIYLDEVPDENTLRSREAGCE